MFVWGKLIKTVFKSISRQTSLTLKIDMASASKFCLSTSWFFRVLKVGWVEVTGSVLTTGSGIKLRENY